MSHIHIDILDRYDSILSVYAQNIECKPEPGTSFAHLRWMIQELRTMDDEPKEMRWLGFIQGIIIAHSLTTVSIERDFTRPYFNPVVENMTDDCIEIMPWIKEGDLLVNTYALDISHEMHPYNQILAMGKRPEDYGMQHPYVEEFSSKTKEELIEEIISYRREIEAWAKGDASGMIYNRKV